MRELEQFKAMLDRANIYYRVLDAYPVGSSDYDLPSGYRVVIEQVRSVKGVFRDVPVCMFDFDAKTLKLTSIG